MLLQSPSGLLIEASTGSSDGVLDKFYQDYDAAFVLENEKERLSGFVECLALNGEAYGALAARFGPFREFVLVARADAAGPRIGGANFIVFPLRRPGETGASLLSLHLNYVFINPPARRRGYLRRLVHDLPGIALRLFAATNPSDIPRQWTGPTGTTAPATPQTLIFIEQNDPYRMPPDDYELDTRHAGLDQIARLGVWSRLGARIVDFPYVQPPLSANQAPDHNLLLAVLGAGADDLDACVLHDDLSRFFAISVLKGEDPSRDPEAAKQLLALTASCRERKPIPLIAARALQQLPARDLPETAFTPASLRDLLRTQLG
jgi:hypothetical protein